MSICEPCGHDKAANLHTMLQNADTLYRVSAQYKAHWEPSPYLFVDENDTKFEDTDLNLLISRITQFRHEGNLPAIPYLKDIIINFTLLSSDTYAPYREMYSPDHKVRVSTKQFVRSALAYTKARMFKSDEELFVDKEIANKRARVCVHCPYNVAQVNGRNTQSPSLAQSKFCSLKGNRHTDLDGMLHICGQCSCLNHCKVHFTKEFIKEASSKELLERLATTFLGTHGKSMKCWITDDKIE